MHAINIPKHLCHKHLKKFALNFFFLALYFLKIVLLSANQLIKMKKFFMYIITGNTDNPTDGEGKNRPNVTLTF